MYTKHLFIILFFSLIFLAESSKILMIFNHFTKSHTIQGRALGKSLATSGHSVTFVTVFPDDEKVDNYTEIVLDGLLKTLSFKITMDRYNLLTMLKGAYMLSTKYTEDTINNPNFKKLLESNRTFDIVILDERFNAALRGISCHFAAPYILYKATTTSTCINEAIGMPAPPSYIPHIWMGYSKKMTFLQRTQNFLYVLLETMYVHSVYYPTHNVLIKKYFPKCPELSVIDKNISVVLLNTHESINNPFPTVPVVVNILGFHLKQYMSLPRDLQTFMDTAEQGVVLFIFGSSKFLSTLDSKIKNAFINSFGKLKQKVLWKTDEDDVENVPFNVRLSKWLPQQDILAHPNTKLFITHGGFISMIETLNHGVPVLTIPLFGDHYANTAKYLDLGVGLAINIGDITEEKLDASFEELLNNKSYAQKAKAISALMNDRPLKPIDLAKYWVEYVIRNKGAPHLKIAGLELPWYQYFLLDVIVFLVTIPVLIWYLLKRLIKAFLGKNKEKQH